MVITAEQLKEVGFEIGENDKVFFFRPKGATFVIVTTNVAKAIEELNRHPWEQGNEISG
jgi:hypothetical protein